MTKRQPMSVAARKAPRGAAFYAALLRAAAGQFNSQVALRSIFCAVLVTAGAAEGVRFGVLERPLSVYASYEDTDPVIAKVGHEVLRVSDAMAHALYSGAAPDEAADLPALMASGKIDEAVDHLTLAQIARQKGFDRSLEIRAAVALAERRILAETLLETVANEAASEERVRAAYEAERLSLADNAVLRLSEIVVGTKEEAEAVRGRLPRASFGALAKSKSIAATANKGGVLGDVEARDLDPALRAALAELTVGGVTEPMQTTEGWRIVKLSSRRAVRMASFEERREEIARRLREEAISELLGEARSSVRAEVRTAEAVLKDVQAAPAIASLATVRFAQ
jgi:peptidyl-prolyl cis-trans isomerase C